MSKSSYKAKQEGHLPREFYKGKIPRHILTLRIYRIWKRSLSKNDRRTRKMFKDFNSELMQDVTCWPPAGNRHPRFRERW